MVAGSLLARCTAPYSKRSRGGGSATQRRHGGVRVSGRGGGGDRGRGRVAVRLRRWRSAGAMRTPKFGASAMGMGSMRG